MNNIFETKAVIYDMDGVLVDSEPLWEESEREVLLELGYDNNSMAEQLNLNTAGMRVNDVVDLFCQTLPDRKINSTEIANRIIDGTIKRVTKIKLILPGVVESLELCRSLDLKIGLASSSAMRVIDAVIESLNIADYFDIRVSAEKLEVGKPNPAVYLLAAKEIGENPLNCLSIEDSIAGMIATKAARMRSIVVPASYDKNKPQWSLADDQLSSLHELNQKHFK